MAFFSSSPLSGREEALYIGGPFTKVVLFDLEVAAASIRRELYGREKCSRRIVARQTLESSLEPRLLWVVWNLVYLTLML